MAAVGGISSTLHRLIGMLRSGFTPEPSKSEGGGFQEQGGLRYHVSKQEVCNLSSLVEGEGKPGHEYGRQNNHARSHSNQTPNVENRQSSQKRQKRQRNVLHNSDSSDYGDLEGRQPKRHRGHQIKDLSEQKPLACPFWKADPYKYRACLKKRLGGINYIKQHLRRCHTPDFYCQICLNIFTNELLFDQHINQRSCEHTPSSKLDGISTYQAKQLSKRVQGSVEKQWFSMWDIVFPACKHPRSIYFDLDESEEFCQIREFVQQKGGEILLEAMQASGNIDKTGIPKEQLQQCFQQGMDLIFEHYRTNHPRRSSMRTGAEQPVAPSTYFTSNSTWPPQQQRIPAGPILESAVVQQAEEFGPASGNSSIASSFMTTDTMSPTDSRHDNHLKSMEPIKAKPEPLLSSSKPSSQTVDFGVFIDNSSIFGGTNISDGVVPPLQKIINDPRLLGLVPENQGRILPDLNRTTGLLDTNIGRVELEETLGWKPFQEYGLFLQDYA